MQINCDGSMLMESKEVDLCNIHPTLSPSKMEKLSHFLGKWWNMYRQIFRFFLLFGDSLRNKKCVIITSTVKLPPTHIINVFQSIKLPKIWGSYLKCFFTFVRSKILRDFFQKFSQSENFRWPKISNLGQ